MTSGINIEEYRGVPARALNMSIRNFLATMLDREEVSTTSRNHCKNWEGLAELLGFNYEEIMKFNNHGSRGKTKMLLGDYTMGGGDIAKLLQSVQELERFDILEDVMFQQSLRADVASFLASQQQQIAQRAPEQGSLQDPEVTSAGQFGQFTDYESEDTVALTIQDSETGIATTYDAYVIYADKDFPFVREMMTQLEDNFGLRLCISNRDMLAGSAQFQAIAAMIKERCSKVIVVMSPAFRDSPMCTFATNFAFSLCPRADVASFLASQQQQIAQRAPEQSSLQDPEVTSAGQFGQFTDYESEDTVALTIQDSETGIATTYDAYVIYADKDFPFVREMMTQLEDNFGLRLCISNRDMLAGSAQFQAIAAMIKERCSKVIVVMSPAFRDSPMCTFATNFAFSLCPSTLKGILVPILYTPCKIPDILLYIAPLDFTKVEYIQWFWQRLQHSLRPIHVTTVRNIQQEQPPPYQDNDMTINDVDVIPCNSGKCTRDPVVSMADVDGAIGGALESAVLPHPPSMTDRTSGIDSLPSGSGKRKKTYFFTRNKPKSKPQSQRRPAHTTSHVMTPESS